MRLSPLILGIVLIAGSPANADEIRLRNGSVIQGRIVREDKDVVVIEIGRGRMNLARRDIAAISVSRAEPVEPATAPVGRNPAIRPGTAPPGRGIRTAAEDTPATEDASTPRGSITPLPRKFRGAPTQGPKIVPVERMPVQPLPSVGPESEAPARKSPTRAPPAGDSKGSASKQTASRATPTPDW